MFATFETLKFAKFKCYVNCKTSFSLSQSWSAQRCKRNTNSSFAKQESTKASRKLWRFKEGSIQHALLPGAPSLPWSHFICEGGASWQSFYERGWWARPLIIEKKSQCLFLHPTEICGDVYHLYAEGCGKEAKPVKRQHFFLSLKRVGAGNFFMALIDFQMLFEKTNADDWCCILLYTVKLF